MQQNIAMGKYEGITCPKQCNVNTMGKNTTNIQQSKNINGVELRVKSSDSKLLQTLKLYRICLTVNH
jgi:hypothetical protein